MLRCALPHLTEDEAWRSLRRFSGQSRIGTPPPVAYDLLFTAVKFPAIIAFLLWRSRRRSAARTRFDVLLYCGERSYFEGRFVGIAKALRGVSVGIAGRGEGMDAPRLKWNFDLRAVGRIALTSLWATPALLVLSCVVRSNLLRGFQRSCAVFAQSVHYFHRTPASVFLTYEENSCSPPFHAGFRAAGGRVLAAFQNGIWYNDEGFDHSSIDILFPLGAAWGERHRRLGSRTGAVVPIGGLLLGSHPEQVAGVVPRFDVVFIDQGTPDAGAQHWSTTGPGGAHVFLSFVRRFAREHTALKIAYQKRSYSKAHAFIESSLSRCFEGVPMTVVEGTDFMAAYRTVKASRVTVTMNSTLGLEAFALGSTPVFCNFTGKPEYDVLPGALQVNVADYDVFRDRVLDALAGRIGSADVASDYFFAGATEDAPRLVAETLRRAMV